MAGEMEKPISFQADSIHSGSISFGRFETEPLFWERRSSFLHNRYLEEVEKCSTPGSVTQKKAYFEAHFKKKAVLSQASAECQNGMEYRTTENDILDHMNYVEEFEHSNVGSHFLYYDESPHGSFCQGESHELGCDEISSSKDINDSATLTLTNDDLVFDGALAFTNDDAVLEDDLQVNSPPLTSDDAVLNGDLQDNVPCPTNDEVLDADLQDTEPAEMHQILFECSTLPLVKDEPGVELKDNLADETENVGTLQRTSSVPKSHVDLKDGRPSLKKSQRQTLKVKATTETKTAKMKLMAQVPRKISSEAPKDSTKHLRREKKSLLRSKTEKPSPPKALPTFSSLEITTKPKDPENLKAKVSQDNRSEKHLKAKKAGTKSQLSTLEKREPKASHSANRHRRTISSTGSDVKPSSAFLHFESDQKAVNRKEFFMEFEEKMHAKEAGMNQIQAITQEETKAKLKQLRKSLNFKASPKPYFYHEAAPQGSDGKRVVSTHMKSTKWQRKSSTSPRCTVTGGSPPFSNAGSQQDVSAGEFEKKAAHPQASEETDCSPTVASEVGESTPSASTNKHCNSKDVKRGDSVRKKDLGKGKNCKQQGSEGSKLKKERIEGRRVVGAVGGSSGELVRKVMKGVRSIGVGGGSGMGYLAVGIDS